MKKRAINIAESMNVQARYSGNTTTLYLSGQRAEEALMAIVNTFNAHLNFDLEVEE